MHTGWFFSLPIINLLLGNALLLYGDSLFWLFLRVKGLSRPRIQTTLIKAITKFFKWLVITSLILAQIGQCKCHTCNWTV